MVKKRRHWSQARPMIQVRVAGNAVKIFVQENQNSEQTEHMRAFLHIVEELMRAMEAMTVSARTVQKDVRDYFLPLSSADDVSPSAGDCVLNS